MHLPHDGSSARSLTSILRINWLLIAAIVLAAALRFWSIGFGLPYIVHPDESVTVGIALRMLHTGDLNPNFFHWSSFTIYLTALAYSLFFLFGRVSGRFTGPTDLLPLDIEAIATGKVNLVEEFLIGRSLNILAGVAAIIVVYHICREVLKKDAAAWIAAFLLALEAISARNSQIIHPDTFVVLFVLLASFFAIKILDDPRLRNYLLAAIFAGIATGSKYNAAIVCVAIPTAHLLRFGWRGMMRKEIYLAALASLIAFLVTTPYAILDFQQFYAFGPIADVTHYSLGHPGAEGNSLRWYIEALWGSLGWLLIASHAQIGLSFIRRDKKEIVLASFPLVYLAFVSQFTVRFETTILPVISYLLIFAALFLDNALDWLHNHVASRTVVRVLASVVILALTLPLLGATMASDANLLRSNGRDLARAWIESNLPVGSRVAIESYAPYLDRSKFMVEGFEGMIKHSPEWYERNGFEYFVFSSGSYGRFYENPTLYADFVRQYDAFFVRYQVLSQFDQNGFQVRVYKNESAKLPANRASVRFGLYGGWVELIGYDFGGKWISGETQKLNFYWRTLTLRREMLTVSLRLIDRNGLEISRSRGPLFGSADTDERWQEGITRSSMNILVPPETVAGMFRIQLEVDAESAGRVPVLSYANQLLSDKLFIGPFKVSERAVSSDEISQSRPINANFANKISLLGLTLNGSQPRAGQTVTLTLFWRADRHVEDNYTIFIHLIDDHGAMRAQLDTQPREGNYPTSIWDTGEIVRDTYLLNLPAELTPGDYRIVLGLYQYPNLSRLQLFDSNGQPLGDQVTLDQAIRVR